MSALLILIFLGGAILTATVTVLYPSFKSIKALETKHTDEDDKAWLTYWVVYGVMTLLDEFAFFILDFIPFYSYVRFLFFVWLMAPQTQGAAIVYRSVLRPLLNQHKDKIDRIIAEVKGVAFEAQKSAMDEMSKPENLSRMGTAASHMQSHVPDVGMSLNNK